MSRDKLQIAGNKIGHDLDAILARIKDIEAVKLDNQLSTPLRAAAGTISAWRKRDSVPHEKIHEYAREKGISLEWLLNGRGPVYLKDMVMDSGGIYEVETNQDVVYEIAADVIDYLVTHDIELPRKKIHALVKLLHRDALKMGWTTVQMSRIKQFIDMAN